MAYNALRRDIAAYIDSSIDAIDAVSLLTRALAALGGPVQDNRPPTPIEVVEAVAEPVDVSTPGYMECDK